MKNKKTKNITKPMLVQKGKKVFGDMKSFNNWLNSDHIPFGCKPISLYDNDRIKELYDELIRIEKNGR